MPIATQLTIFIFGLFIGSFLNVVVFRMHSGESIVFGRSHCLKCKKELSWYELIPVLSFVMQKGKCRRCASPLSWQYPIGEVATGLIFGYSFFSLANVSYLPPSMRFAWNVFSYNLNGAPLHAPTLLILGVISLVWAICSLCIVIGIYDFRYSLIPDACIASGSALLLLAGIIGIWRVPTVSQFFPTILILPLWTYFLALIVTAIFCAFPFFLIVFISQGKWMGMGDVKLAFFMGMILGLHAFLAIFVAVISGAIIGVILMALGRAGMKTLLPFGPFLVFGTLLILFFGQAVSNYFGGYFYIP